MSGFVAGKQNFTVEVINTGPGPRSNRRYSETGEFEAALQIAKDQGATTGAVDMVFDLIHKKVRFYPREEEAILRALAAHPAISLRVAWGVHHWPTLDLDEPLKGNPALPLFALENPDEGKDLLHSLGLL